MPFPILFFQPVSTATLFVFFWGGSKQQSRGITRRLVSMDSLFRAPRELKFGPRLGTLRGMQKVGCENHQLHIAELSNTNERFHGISLTKRTNVNHQKVEFGFIQMKHFVIMFWGVGEPVKRRCDIADMRRTYSLKRISTGQAQNLEEKTRVFGMKMHNLSNDLLNLSNFFGTITATAWSPLDRDLLSRVFFCLWFP